jgi:lysophospholipase L1-like esterase
MDLRARRFGVGRIDDSSPAEHEKELIMRRFLLVSILAGTCPIFGQILTDSLSGTAGTDFALHAATSGATWTNVASGLGAGGTMLLNGTGFTNAGGSGAALYNSNVSIANNQTVVYTADVVLSSDINAFVGIGVYNASGNGYHLTYWNSQFSGGGGWGIERMVTSTPSFTALTASARGTQTNGTYNLVFVYSTSGTTATMSALVMKGGAVIWNSGRVTDSTYPDAVRLAVRGYTVAAGSLSTGPHIGNLNARTSFTPVTDAGFYFSPATWLVSGSSYAVTPSAGSYFYFSFTGTSAVLLADTTVLGANPLYTRCRVDYGPWADINIQGSSLIPLQMGLSNAAHTVQCIYKGRLTGLDSWNTPVDGLKITGVSLSAGATTTAPAVKTNRLLVFGDSRVECYHCLSTTDGAGQDASAGAAFMLAESLNAELGLAAFSGAGWSVTGSTNVPALFTPGNDGASYWNKLFAGQSRSFAGLTHVVVLNLGTNDYTRGATDAAVTASVSGFLAAMRAAAPSAQIVIVPSYEGWKLSAITAGFNNYQAAIPDGKAFLVPLGLTATEAASISTNDGNPTYTTLDGLHPQTYTQGLIGGKISGLIQQAIGGVIKGSVSVQ